jgi:hypothetical protein
MVYVQLFSIFFNFPLLLLQIGRNIRIYFYFVFFNILYLLIKLKWQYG